MSTPGSRWRSSRARTRLDSRFSGAARAAGAVGTLAVIDVGGGSTEIAVGAAAGLVVARRVDSGRLLRARRRTWSSIHPTERGARGRTRRGRACVQRVRCARRRPRRGRRRQRDLAAAPGRAAARARRARRRARCAVRGADGGRGVAASAWTPCGCAFSRPAYSCSPNSARLLDRPLQICKGGLREGVILEMIGRPSSWRKRATFPASRRISRSAKLPRSPARGRMSTTEQQPAAVAPPALDAPELYFNRELSWLDFNERVLELAEDESTPLLERAKFLAIYTSNLDEFVMVRVAGPARPGRRRRRGAQGRRPDRLGDDRPDRREARRRATSGTRVAWENGDQPRAGRARHPDRHLRELRRRRARAKSTRSSRSRSSRCSRRSRSGPAGRSRTSRTCRSALR